MIRPHASRFASLIDARKTIGVEPYAYLFDLFTKQANGHLYKYIVALMSWAYATTAVPSQ